MEAVLVNAVVSPAFTVSADLLTPSPSLPFLSGLLFLQDIPTDDPYPLLDQLSKAIQCLPASLPSAALSLKLFTSIATITAFPTPFEETKCVIILKKTVNSLPSFDSIPVSVRFSVISALEKALTALITALSGGKQYLDLGETVSKRWDLLGQPILARLSPRSVQFLEGNTTENCEIIVNEVVSVCKQCELLKIMLFFRVFALIQSENTAKIVQNALKFTESVFSRKETSLLAAFIPPIIAPDVEKPTFDQFSRLYSLIRRDLTNGVFVQVDQIALELKKIAISEEKTTELYGISMDLLKNEENTEQNALIWKLILFGMHTIRLFTGKMWGDINDELNVRFKKGKKKEKKAKISTEDAKIEEIKQENTVKTVKTEENPAKLPEITEKPVKTTEKMQKKGWKKVEKRPNPTQTPIIPAIPPATPPAPPTTPPVSSDFNPLFSPWDLPNSDSIPEKPQKPPKPQGSKKNKAKK